MTAGVDPCPAGCVRVGLCLACGVRAPVLLVVCRAGPCLACGVPGRPLSCLWCAGPLSCLWCAGPASVLLVVCRAPVLIVAHFGQVSGCCMAAWLAVCGQASLRVS